VNLDPTKAWIGKSLKHGTMLTCARISPCGKFVAAGGADAKAQVWNLESGERTELDGHSGYLAGVAYLPDGRLLTADRHGTVHLRADSKVVWTIRDAHAGWIRALAASPDGKTLVTAGHDPVVRQWSSEDGKKLREFPGHANVYSALFHPEGKALVTGDLMGVLRHWDLETGKLVRELDAKALHTRSEDFLADVGGVRSLAFTAKGDELAAGGIREAKSNTFCPGLPTVLVFDWASGKQKLMHVPREEKIDGYVNSLRYLPDGSLAGVGEAHAAGAFFVWKPGEAASIHAMHLQSAYEIDLHPDGLRLFLASFEPKGKGGNGRHAGRAEYVPNAGCVNELNLFAKPAPPKPAPKK
jgi:WD40 repeat protein